MAAAAAGAAAAIHVLARYIHDVEETEPIHLQYDDRAIRIEP